MYTAAEIKVLAGQNAISRRPGLSQLPSSAVFARYRFHIRSRNRFRKNRVRVRTCRSVNTVAVCRQ